MSYAAQKGRATLPAAPATIAQAELNAAQEARIDGWRAVKNCNLNERT